MYVVLVETSGNQDYIFATNKLRENVGASELTYRVGTKYVLEAVRPAFNYDGDVNGSKLRKLLLDEMSIDEQTDPDSVEIIIATSGKALLLTKKAERAKAIVAHVTSQVLKYAPGLLVHGAIVAVDPNRGINAAIDEVHRRHSWIRNETPHTSQRFQRLPFFEPCETSNLPAKDFYRHLSLPTSERAKPHSGMSISKQETSSQGRDRLEGTLIAIDPSVRSLSSIRQLEKRFKTTRWLAIIHADGNGLGEIFQHFDQFSGATGSDYVEKYRRFSLDLDDCTVRAAASALRNLQQSWSEDNPPEVSGVDTIEAPFIPLILGGDDLTVICDGEYALKFTYDFL